VALSMSLYSLGVFGDGAMVFILSLVWTSLTSYQTIMLYKGLLHTLCLVVSLNNMGVGKHEFQSAWGWALSRLSSYVRPSGTTTELQKLIVH
jgi:hypothetical protein